MLAQYWNNPVLADCDVCIVASDGTVHKTLRCHALILNTECQAYNAKRSFFEDGERTAGPPDFELLAETDDDINLLELMVHSMYDPDAGDIKTKDVSRLVRLLVLCNRYQVASLSKAIWSNLCSRDDLTYADAICIIEYMDRLNINDDPMERKLVKTLCDSTNDDDGGSKPCYSISDAMERKLAKGIVEYMHIGDWKFEYYWALEDNRTKFVRLPVLAARCVLSSDNLKVSSENTVYWAACAVAATNESGKQDILDCVRLEFLDTCFVMDLLRDGRSPFGTKELVDVLARQQGFIPKRPRKQCERPWLSLQLRFYVSRLPCSSSSALAGYTWHIIVSKYTETAVRVNLTNRLMGIDSDFVSAVNFKQANCTKTESGSFDFIIDIADKLLNVNQGSISSLFHFHNGEISTHLVYNDDKYTFNVNVQCDEGSSSDFSSDDDDEY